MVLNVGGATLKKFESWDQKENNYNVKLEQSEILKLRVNGKSQQFKSRLVEVSHDISTPLSR